MDSSYEVYCLADPVFYDSPVRGRRGESDFRTACRPVPHGWSRVELDDWLVYGPHGAVVPPQGWKIHASACLDDAEAVVAAAWDYCVARRIPFKFIRSQELYFVRNTKYAHRGSSGKLVTIYPADEAQLEVVLTELGAILEGRAGPYILSDLRWGPGPLYVRYGGFADRYCVGPSGDVEPAIADATGRMVPDRRGPTFEIPPWVSLPACLEPHMAARNQSTVNEIPYRIESALHFSNGGGVYTGVDERTGERVVLKEARPYAGLALDRADAVTRLGRESEMLERLAGLDLVPAVRDRFVLGDHHFLVEDFIEATALRAQLVERYPLVLQETGPAEAAAYSGWALELFARVEQAVAAVHERGVVLGDLHPLNILVRPDGRIAIIDLEVATDVHARRRQTLADPGFVAPYGCTGFAIDEYALACLRLFMFMPLTTLIGLAPEKAERFAADIAAEFPVPHTFLDEAVATIAGAHAAGAPRRRGDVGGRPSRLEPDADGWAWARASMAEGIVASATPEREDRLFPGDVKQFPGGGLNVAYGAAGVLYALAQTGARRHPRLEDWLVQRAQDPAPGSALGFYDGLHGVAHVLEVLGRRDDALRVLERCDDEIAGRWERLGSDLHSGLAGIGCNLLHFAQRTGDTAFSDAAAAVAHVLVDRVGDELDVAEISGGDHPYAGLPRGSAGLALFLIRLYEHTGEEHLLDVAATALRQDLRRCFLRDDGALEVNEGWRTMPYLADGSVGIGLVLADYLALRDDGRLASAAAAIRRAAEAQFYVEPGLFWGRAGMILSLSRGHAPGTAAAADPVVAAQVRRLDWHALTYRGHLAFPGEQLLRLSMDLGTGTAGVLLALGAALHDAPVHLPFLGALPAQRADQLDDLEFSGRR